MPRPTATTRAVVVSFLMGALWTVPAAAATPTPLDPALFSFPGAITAPASGASAGLALADRWLADEPYANPAAAGGPHVSASGTLLHLSRQDLAAHNRNYDETPAFFDGSSVAVGLPAFGRLGSTLYAHQSVLRLENNAFSRGRGTPDPANPPAALETHARARELNAGLALSVGVGKGRIGVGVEWTRRQDSYSTLERSGSPDAGTKRLEFTGNTVGFQAGARLDRGDTLAGGLSVGLAVRYLPALRFDASHSEVLLVGTLSETLSVERASGWEIGGSGRYQVSPAFRALAAIGGRSEQRWEGFDLVAGRAWEWKVAGEFHDARDPWTLRFGIGQERQTAVPEPRADILSVGVGWRGESTTLDLGIAHRTLKRASAPNSFDDRLVVSVRTPL